MSDNDLERLCTYNRKSNGPWIEPYGTPYLTFQPQKKQYQYKPRTFCLKNRNQIILLKMSGNQNISFFNENYMV